MTNGSVRGRRVARMKIPLDRNPELREEGTCISISVEARDGGAKAHG